MAGLYQRALPAIYRYVLARSQRLDLAEDIVSDVFLTMVETIGELRATHEAGFFAWLLRIAQRKVARALQQAQQQRARQHPLPESDNDLAWLDPALTATDLASNPQALQEWRELIQDLGLALGTLNDEQQLVIIGRFLQGQSIEALAQELGRPQGTVRILQFRALRVLAERLGTPRRSQRRDTGG